VCQQDLWSQPLPRFQALPESAGRRFFAVTNILCVGLSNLEWIISNVQGNHSLHWIRPSMLMRNMMKPWKKCWPWWDSFCPLILEGHLQPNSVGGTLKIRSTFLQQQQQQQQQQQPTDPASAAAEVQLGASGRSSSRHILKILL